MRSFQNRQMNGSQNNSAYRQESIEFAMKMHAFLLAAAPEAVFKVGQITEENGIYRLQVRLNESNAAVLNCVVNSNGHKRLKPDMCLGLNDISQHAAYSYYCPLHRMKKAKLRGEDEKTNIESFRGIIKEFLGRFAPIAQEKSLSCPFPVCGNGAELKRKAAKKLILGIVGQKAEIYGPAYADGRMDACAFSAVIPGPTQYAAMYVLWSDGKGQSYASFRDFAFSKSEIRMTDYTLKLQSFGLHGENFVFVASLAPRKGGKVLQETIVKPVFELVR